MGRGKYGRYTIRHWRAVRDALARGGSIRSVAAETGVARSTVLGWSRMDAAPDRMWLAMETPDPDGPVAAKASPRARLDLARRVVIEVRLRVCPWPPTSLLGCPARHDLFAALVGAFGLSVQAD